MQILFVCTGNTCRSAMCEGIFKSLVELSNIKVLSAGINACNGDKANENAIEALNEMGIDISNHTAKLLTKGDVLDSDLIITMTSMHKSIIISNCPNAKDKVFTIYEYAGCGDGQVTDPYGMSIDVYKNCALELKKLLEIILKKVIEKNDKAD